MSAQAYSAVVANLSNLTPNEIKNVEGLITYHSQKQQMHEDPKAPSLNEFYYKAITDKLRDRGIGPHRPFASFKRRSEAAIFTKAVPAFEEFIKEHFGESITKVRKRNAILALTALIVRDLEKKGISIDFTSFSYQIPRLPFIVDEWFPGYMDSGLIAKIVRTDVDLNS